MSNTALIIIDLQNDYFPGGAYPQWQADEVKDRIIAAADLAKANDFLPILVQHVADTSAGPAPFFIEGTPGVEICNDIKAAFPEAPVVIKHWADSFYKTDLEQILDQYNIKKLLVCGMMTQNCATHTALSKTAEKYEDVAIVTDWCTTVTELLHLIALHAVSTRINLVESASITPVN